MPTDPLDRPRLRPGLQFAADPRDPDAVYVLDRAGVNRGAVRLARFAFHVARHFGGDHSLRDVQRELTRRGGGELLPLAGLRSLAERLDDANCLDTPRFRKRIGWDGDARPPSCIGVYPDDPDGVRRTLEPLFTGPGGPGPVGPRQAGGPRLRAVLVPHMDYARGGVTYGWGFKELAERTDARLFVVVGTSHHSPARFTLTRKHFRTPLGTVETDGSFIDRLVGHYGGGLFDDELAHWPEHSIELEVLVMQHVLAGHPFRIVPLLVGPFHDRVEAEDDPGRCVDIGRMVESLRLAEAAAGEPVCYVISGDLAHIGPKFDDPEPVGEAQLAHCERQDRLILGRAEAADAAGYFGVIAAEQDERRICGMPPTWTVLSAARPERGRTLHYGRFVDPAGTESVSFASVAFDE